MALVLAVAGEGTARRLLSRRAAGLLGCRRPRYGEAHLLLVQMHGESGVGKSTVARLLGRELPAVVLDKDLLKDPGHGLGLGSDLSGRYAYDALFALAGDLLAQGHEVILDSPAFWPKIEQRGRTVADRLGAVWVMVEVVCDDAVEHRRRMSNRDALLWQPTEPRTDPLPPGAREPTCERIIVDTLQPLDAAVTQAVQALRGQMPSEPRHQHGRGRRAR